MKGESVRPSTSHEHAHDSERYSARQDAMLKMGGIVGEAVYEGDTDGFALILALGGIVHVGKGTGLGLGLVQRHAPDNGSN